MKTMTAICLLVMFSVTWAHADRNPPTLTNLVESSALIVVGRVTNVHTTAREHETLDYTANLSVDSVLKGFAQTNLVIQWNYRPGLEDDCDFTMFAGQTRVWFLWRRQADGSYVMVFEEECLGIELRKNVEGILKRHNQASQAIGAPGAPQPERDVGPEGRSR